MKNQKPKSEAIIEEIIGKMSTPGAPIVITAVVDKILSYKRVSCGTTILRVILNNKL